MAVDQYSALARQYRLLADRAATPLLADGYRKLAEGYATLAQAHKPAAPDDAAPDDAAVLGRKPRQPA